MDLEIVIWSKESQLEKDKNHKILLTCGILKRLLMNLSTKQKQSYRYKKQIYGYQRVSWGGIN